MGLKKYAWTRARLAILRGDLEAAQRLLEEGIDKSYDVRIPLPGLLVLRQGAGFDAGEVLARLKLTQPGDREQMGIFLSAVKGDVEGAADFGAKLPPSDYRSVPLALVRGTVARGGGEH